jgi:hypothetical protein
MMRVLLELLRIVIIFTVLGGLAWEVVQSIYTSNETTKAYQWLGGVAIYMLLFVLYRNKLQFNGWYIGNGRKKLPSVVTTTLVWSSIILIVSPFVIRLVFH